jgi:hypothetical protein
LVEKLAAFIIRLAMASPILTPTTTAFSLALLLGASGAARADEATVLLEDLSGEVKIHAPDTKGAEFSPVSKGARLADGTRLRTGEGGEARLKFPDGSVSSVKASSEIIVRASGDPRAKPNGVVLSLGRLWSSVVKSGGETSFEVRSANAVAGVRGTDFEVGVALDGSTRVVVKEGEVGVAGESDDERAVGVKGGNEVESSHQGRLDKVKKAAEKPDWDGWFSARAKAMEKTGMEVAKDLDGRLNRRKEKLKKLVGEQKTLRRQIEALEARKKHGEDVDRALEEKLAQLTRVTARLTDMKERLQGAFGLFARWGAMAKQGGMAESGAMSRMCDDVAKVAADFADMIEEGTDMSQEGMDDMMKDMRNGKSDRPNKNAGDELFR